MKTKHFPWVLVVCEMQTAFSRIWTQVIMFISYDSNYYTTNASTICFDCMIFYEKSYIPGIFGFEENIF